MNMIILKNYLFLCLYDNYNSILFEKLRQHHVRFIDPKILNFKTVMDIYYVKLKYKNEYI